MFSEKGNRYCEVVVFFGERNCRLRALIDTGNTLKDTVSKDPVSVMDQASVKRLTEGKQPERFRYIPYHSIGKKEGVMPAFRMDKIQIIRDGYRINVEYPLVAVCEEELGSENYQMIIRMRFGLGTEDGEEKTQKEVADMLGISQSYISRLEKKIMQRLRREMVKYS